jgi:hypothetical protein
VIEPRLSAAALTAQDVCAFMRNDEWIAIEFRNAQLAFIEQFAKIEFGGRFDPTVLAELFDLTSSRVRTIQANVQRKQWPPYRPPTLSDQQAFELCQMT